MKKDSRLYLADLCKYFGFAFNLPIGQHFLNLIFKTGEATSGSFTYSLLISLLGFSLLILGGIITDGRFNHAFKFFRAN